MKKTDSRESGLLLLSKKPSLTSFSSLWSVKRALGTEKVGHTGTLDSFAEGLLVVLSGHLTHLVPHITAFTKTYKAVVCFGKETDTLDPTGTVIKTGQPVSEEKVRSVLPSFTGALLQEPPVFSALHVNGKRSSDIARSGQEVHLEKRQIFIYSLKLLDFMEEGPDGCSYGILEVCCSKGTYIRALARDIAAAAGSCAFLCALRRTSVGPFQLEDAAGSESLKPFTIPYGIELYRTLAENKPSLRDEGEEKRIQAQIRSRFMHFNGELASQCGFTSLTLKDEYKASYMNGRPLSARMFDELKTEAPVNGDFLRKNDRSVFYSDGSFAGMIEVNEERRHFYGFVVPWTQKKTRIFTWEEVMEGAFPREMSSRGTALTTGSFDGIHSGHQALFSRIKKEGLYAGAVTFRSPFKAQNQDYTGNVISFNRKMDLCAQQGLDFVVVIDFSSHFSKINGQDFIKILVRFLGMKVLAEGEDFRCGYKGLFGMEEIARLADEEGFILRTVPYVNCDGVRVSSSLVRQKILDADFACVEKLLLRPFVYDVQDPAVKLEEELSSSSWFSWKRTEQILPQNGEYRVVVLMENQELHSLCRITDKKIFLNLPTMNFASKVKAVQFIAPNT